MARPSPQGAADGPPPGPTGAAGPGARWPGTRRPGDTDGDRHAPPRDAGPGPAGLDHLPQLRPGQRPDPRLLLALRHGARPGRRGERPGRRRAAHVGRSIPPVAIARRHRRGRRARRPRVRVPAAEGVAGAVVRGQRHRGPVRRRRERPAVGRGERIARASASGAVESAVAERPSASPAPPVPTGRIVFQARKNANSDVMVWSADTGDIEKLAGGKGDQSEPAWSPDGDASSTSTASRPSAPTAARPTRACASSRTTAATADVFDFTHHDVDRNPAWSPDGGTIVFSSTRDHTQNKNLDIYSRACTRRRPARTSLVDNPADDWDPAWSPDGNRIVFVSERNGDAHLFTMRPNGNGQVPLKLGNGIFDDPAFSPDGENLAFTRRDNANAQKQLFVANADGSDMHAGRRRSTPT